MFLYGGPGLHEEPHWFDLDEWKHFDAYGSGEEDPETRWVSADRLLLYNEDLSCAYFIQYELTVTDRDKFDTKLRQVRKNVGDINLEK